MSGFLGMMFPGGGSGGLPPITPSTYIAFGGTTAAKRISVYGWDSTAGFGSLFTTPSIPNNINQVSFVRDNSVFSASFAAAPCALPWPHQHLHLQGPCKELPALVEGHQTPHGSAPRPLDAESSIYGQPHEHGGTNHPGKPYNRQ
jgi:hypothetical protein